MATEIRYPDIEVQLSEEDSNAFSIIDRDGVGGRELRRTPVPEKRYRVWFTPNPPRPPFTIEVPSLEQAVAFMSVLSHYSLYLGELIPVSAGGIEEGDGDEWEDAYIDEDVLRPMRQAFARATNMTGAS